MKIKLPVLLLGTIALIGGVLASAHFSNRSNDSAQSASSSQVSQEIPQALQDSLQTSIALPLDFKTVPAFELMDDDGATISENVFDDKWSVVFFGYTHCPDVCPVTLQILKNVVAKLEAENKSAPQIVFVSVDPVRDTSEIMKNYISFFNDDFVGITGDVNSVHGLTRALGIVASFTANDQDPENYIVDHTASLLLIDPQKRLRAKITPPHIAEKIMADFLTIANIHS